MESSVLRIPHPNLRVLVTGVGGGTVGEQLVKALRLSSLQCSIYGSNLDRRAYPLTLVDQIVDLPSASHPDYLGELIAVCMQHEISVILPGSDAELRVISNGVSKLESAGLFVPVNPFAVVNLCLDKVQLTTWLESHGFHTPASMILGQDNYHLSSLDYPVIVKPYRMSGGSAHVYLAQSKEELESLRDYLGAFCSELLVQPYVGRSDKEFTVGVLCGPDGVIWQSIAMRRFLDTPLGVRLKAPNRTNRKELGEYLVVSSGLSQGEVREFPEVRSVCELVALKLNARSAINIQCRVDDNNRVWIFEINPRFSGTTAMRAMLGYNEPELLIRRYYLKEQCEQRFSYRHGIVARGLAEAVIPESQLS